MIYQQTTQVPNILFDKYLPNLSESELKIILIIIRQTAGWINTKTGFRKSKDRLSISQFISKTNLSRRVVSSTISKLVNKGLICISCQNGNSLHNAEDRKGKYSMFFSLTCAHNDTNQCTWRHQPVHNSAYNKTKYSKINKTKLNTSPFRTNSLRSVGEILKGNSYY
ncbi:MAG: replication protein [Saprospiraceae bacterium]|nr:replication protein [Saprospiraceae bacterium]